MVVYRPLIGGFLNWSRAEIGTRSNPYFRMKYLQKRSTLIYCFCSAPNAWGAKLWSTGPDFARTGAPPVLSALPSAAKRYIGL